MKKIFSKLGEYLLGAAIITRSESAKLYLQRWKLKE